MIENGREEKTEMVDARGREGSGGTEGEERKQEGEVVSDFENEREKSGAATSAERYCLRIM